MESAQNDSISDDPIEVSTRQQLVELSAKFGHAEQMIASLINEKRNLVAELETQRRQLNVQQKRIDEIQAYGANVAKNATRLKSVIKEILPTLATPTLLNEITETQKSTPPASPVKRTPIIHLDFTPSQLMQAKQKNEVTARMLEFYETPGKKVNFDEFAAPNKTFENVLRPVSTDNITPKVQIEKLSQDALDGLLSENMPNVVAAANVNDSRNEVSSRGRPSKRKSDPIVSNDEPKQMRVTRSQTKDKDQTPGSNKKANSGITPRKVVRFVLPEVKKRSPSQKTGPKKIAGRRSTLHL